MVFEWSGAPAAAVGDQGTDPTHFHLSLPWEPPADYRLLTREVDDQGWFSVGLAGRDI